jgi:hypothetical protein
LAIKNELIRIGQWEIKTWQMPPNC